MAYLGVLDSLKPLPISDALPTMFLDCIALELFRENSRKFVFFNCLHLLQSCLSSLFELFVVRPRKDH